MKLIDKDILVTEIERLRKKNDDYNKPSHIADVCYKEILSLINTLEVKEVDDEPECMIFPRPIGCYSTCKECPYNKAQKGE